MRSPAWWARDGLLPALLSPVATLVAGRTARRVAGPGWRAPVPVVCVGNAGVGGSGKTPVALDIAVRLIAQGRAVGFVSRGHGGAGHLALRVDPARHDAALVGDEPLLLAAVAPTWVGADRAASARAAVAAGADVLVMDDGLQNPTLARDVTLLVIDGGAGFGNGRVLPAGPLREPVAAAAARSNAAVLVGADAMGALARLPAGFPVLRARLLAEAPARPVLAFAGIGRPEKFFAALREAGAELVEAHAFADHHRYRAAELDGLLARAAALGVTAATTAKDAARLPPAVRARVMVVPARLEWHDPAALERLLPCG